MVVGTRGAQAAAAATAAQPATAAAAAAVPAEAPAANPPPVPRRARAQARTRAGQTPAQQRRARANQQPPPQPNFALTPYQAINGIIDYSTTEGRKYYEKATAKLNDDGFDCQADNLRAFIKDLERRAEAFGWTAQNTGILNVPEDVDDLNSPVKNLLKHYGEIDWDQIYEYDETYIQNNTRAAQDSRMLYECIMNSLTKEAKNMITIWEDDFFIGTLPSGNLLFKVVLRESHIDTNATVSTIIARLSSLDTYIVTINSDIKKFNTYVKQQVDSLAARGQHSTDLLANLFKGYLAASDRQFTAYIKGKQERYEEGKIITANQLMIMAKTRYQIIVDKSEWNAPSPEETQILALKAEVNQMKSNQKKATNQTKKNDQPKNEPKNLRFQKKPKWMFEKPKKVDLQKSREWNGATWHWCGTDTGGHCEAYRIHKGNECQGKSFNARKRREKDDNKDDEKQPTKKHAPSTTTKPNSKPLKLAKALAATVVEQDHNSDSDTD